MTYDETLRRLCALRNHGSKFGVERMHVLAGALGHPERAFPAVHIAGSNGKGSTAAMLEQILRDAGIRTGLYTSPHLVRLNERIQINRVPIADERLAEILPELLRTGDAIAAGNPELAPSFFELMTALAFLEFKRCGVEVAVVETGLGGRLDATNILASAVSVITSISIEHAEYLGDTLEQIAGEKGGIIKPRTPVVLGVLPPAAETVLRKIAAERDAPVFSILEHFGSPQNFPHTNLAGAHQRANAATAALAASLLNDVRNGTGIASTDAIAASLRRVNWPARWHPFPLAAGGTLIIDAAHNAECAEAVEPLIAQITRDTGTPPIVVTGALGIERARPLLAMLCRHSREIHLVRPEQERACDFGSLASCLPANYTGTVFHDTLEHLFPAPNTVNFAHSAGTILVIGSVYLAGEVLSRFLADVPQKLLSLQDKLPHPPPADVFTLAQNLLASAGTVQADKP